MKITMKSVVLGLAVAFAASSVMGQAEVTATVSGAGGITAVGGSASAVNAAATGAAGGYTFDLTLDSAADVLVIDAQVSDVVGTLYNELTAGDDINPPSDLFKGLVPDLNADLWITTPGATAAADGASLAGGEPVSHFDTTDEGAQSGFHWASLTLIPDADGNAGATLNATIQTAASPTPLFDDVSVSMSVGGTTIPEPASFGLVITALLGGLGLVRRKRN